MPRSYLRCGQLDHGFAARRRHDLVHVGDEPPHVAVRPYVVDPLAASWEGLMSVGEKRTMIARIGIALGFLCGAIGLLAGLMGRVLKLGPVGWFTGGALLTLIAVFALLDGAIASRKAEKQK